MKVKLMVITLLSIFLAGCYPYHRTNGHCYHQQPCCIKRYCANNCCSCYTIVTDRDFLPDIPAPQPMPKRHSYK